MLKKGLGTVLTGFVLLFIVLAGRAVFYPSRQPEAPPPMTPLVFDEARAVENFQQALNLETISYQEAEKMDAGTFLAFHRLLETAFPKVHETLSREIVHDYSLLYTWKGSDPSLKAVVLLAHYDVVPAPSPETWAYPPFSGELADGFIWGRGALDDKCCVMGILEAIEALLAEGFTPSRTIYAAFGHDEEVGGWDGAARMAGLLGSRGVEAEFVLDEGMAVVEGVLPGLTKPLALIGLTEKGYLTLELRVEAEGGHSSQPPPQTAIGILSAAVARLENRPFKARLRGPMRDTLEHTAPELAAPMRFLFTNLWLFRPLIERQFLGQRTTAAMLRTTTAATIIEGGTKENILPDTARAVVNFRLLPDNSIEEVIEHVRKTIQDDRVEITVLGSANEAPPPSATDSMGYNMLGKTILQAFGDVIVAPSMMLGGSDAHHYSTVSKDIYRFSPLWLSQEDIDRIHGTDERIGRDDYLRGVRFYAQLIRNAN
jgi:carboxypeptidase PM20D1